MNEEKLGAVIRAVCQPDLDSLCFAEEEEEYIYLLGGV